MKRWWLLVPCLAVFAVLLFEAQPAAAIRTYSHDRDGAVRRGAGGGEVVYITQSGKRIPERAVGPLADALQSRG